MARRRKLGVTFWLNVAKHDENNLAGMIEDLKRRRQFTQSCVMAFG